MTDKSFDRSNRRQVARRESAEARYARMLNGTHPDCQNGVGMILKYRRMLDRKSHQ